MGLEDARLLYEIIKMLRSILLFIKISKNIKKISKWNQLLSPFSHLTNDMIPLDIN